jgi:hypothetical protein
MGKERTASSSLSSSDVLVMVVALLDDATRQASAELIEGIRETRKAPPVGASKATRNGTKGAFIILVVFFIVKT